MGMTMSEKILAKHAGLDSVKAGQLVTCELDMVLANDITAPPSIAKFEEIGRLSSTTRRSRSCRITSSRPRTLSRQS